MTKHTPGPWHVDEDKTLAAKAGWRTCIWSSNRPVAYTTYPLAEAAWYAEDAANAKHIVALHNAFLEGGAVAHLLEAAGEALHELRFVYSGYESSSDGSPVHPIPALQAAIAAVQQLMEGTE